jgi:hypothetical protein
MKIDIYTKVILTLIAVALWGIFLSPFFKAEETDAATGIIDVNLKQIDGSSIDRVLDVNIEEVNGSSVYNSLPVEIRQ